MVRVSSSLISVFTEPLGESGGVGSSIISRSMLSKELLGESGGVGSSLIISRSMLSKELGSRWCKALSVKVLGSISGSLVFSGLGLSFGSLKA